MFYLVQYLKFKVAEDGMKDDFVSQRPNYIFEMKLPLIKVENKDGNDSIDIKIYIGVGTSCWELSVQFISPSIVLP